MPKSKKPRIKIKRHKDRGMRGQEAAYRKFQENSYNRQDINSVELKIQPCIICKGKMKKFKDCRPIKGENLPVNQFRCPECWPSSFKIVRPKFKKLPDFVRAEKKPKEKVFADADCTAFFEESHWFTFVDHFYKS